MANLLALNVLSALADDTRRTIFERLSVGPASVGDLASGLPVTRPAVSQHLRVLKDAALVSETAEGTRRIYRLDPRGLAAVREWLDGHWAGALDAFAQSSNEQSRKEDLYDNCTDQAHG